MRAHEQRGRRSQRHFGCGEALVVDIFVVAEHGRQRLEDGAAGKDGGAGVLPEDSVPAGQCVVRVGVVYKT
jgi:hypothetical protein